MRRKPGALLPIEVSILGAGIARRVTAEDEFHGYAIAKDIRDQAGARKLTAQGTLYRALDRLEGLTLLESRLEPAGDAERESRPRRRLYRVTIAGEKAYAAASILRAPITPHTQRTAQA